MKDLHQEGGQALEQGAQGSARITITENVSKKHAALAGHHVTY